MLCNRTMAFFSAPQTCSFRLLIIVIMVIVTYHTAQTNKRAPRESIIAQWASLAGMVG